MAVTIKHEYNIDANIETVWNVLCDGARYHEWNPFVTRVDSTLQVGSPIKMRVNLIPFMTLNQKETMLTYDEGEGFSYGIKLPFGMLSSNRYHKLTKINDDQTQYESSFELKGWVSPIVKLFMHSKLQQGFSGMSAAIKQRSEQLAKAN